MNVAVIGGGAAGFFAAICVKENHPLARVTIYERSKQLLAKVKVSGGGRCNVTNACTDLDALAAAYPRGGRALKKAFRVFSTTETMAWFESRGVPLMTQEDGCVFPASQSSQSILNCFLDRSQELGIEIQQGTHIQALNPQAGKLEMISNHGEALDQLFDKVIIATGGSPRREGLAWIEALGHTISDPVPSLFTFNMPGENITKLPGVVVENTLVSIQGSKLKTQGPLLITHWGMSGPAILKLSAFGARELHTRNYAFKIQVNWTNATDHEQVIQELQKVIVKQPNKILGNIRPFGLPERLWHYLLEKSEIDASLKGSLLGKKAQNKLVNTLTNDVYEVQGKTSFKAEFVTCGGVSLSSINLQTMQSKVCPNLYFAGEVLDIDGITGGYNFQAAWTTAFIAAKLENPRVSQPKPNSPKDGI